MQIAATSAANPVFRAISGSLLSRLSGVPVYACRPRLTSLRRSGAQLLVDQKEELAQLMTREMGKVLPEARGDVQEAIDMSFYMAGEGRRLWGQTTPSELRDKFNMSVRMPIGVIGVITPWNFPIAIPSWKITPALVSGNPIVFKPATDTPLLAERFAELLDEPAVPAGR